jgi:hypothetical protein
MLPLSGEIWDLQADQIWSSRWAATLRDIFDQRAPFGVCGLSDSTGSSHW